MTRLVRYLLVALIGFVFVVGITPSSVAAYDPLTSACDKTTGTGTTDSPTCTSRTSTNPLTGNDGLLLKITRVIAVIAGITAIIVIISSGARYMTAGGDSQKAAGARNALIGALVGLFVISLSTLIINFVLSRI